MNQRVKELDGIRGIAILLVFAFHAFKRADYFTANPILHFITKLTSIGWMGVDLFFVLSGFLITSILLQTKGEKGFFKNFYARRILRIFPLYYVVLALTVYFMPVLEPEANAQTLATLPIFLIYQQNWLLITGDFPSLYLLVTWSLAIEEQFYLFWPLTVYFFEKKKLAWVSVGIITLSSLIRIVAILLYEDAHNAHVFTYYSTVTRLDALAFGALIALAFRESELWKKRLSKMALPALLVTISLVLVAVLQPNSYQVINNNWVRTIGYTLLAMMGGSAVVISLTQNEDSLLRRLFRNKALLFFGKYSYAIYLIHPPILQIFLDLLWDAKFRGWQAYVSYLFISFSLTILLALLSWNLLEKHMLSLKKYFV